MPSLTTPFGMPARASRTPSQSTHRSQPSTVEQVPSVIESPMATMVPVAVVESTSIAFSQRVAVVVPVKGDDSGRDNPGTGGTSFAATLPAPLAVVYDVTIAPPCWLGRTFVPGT